MLSVVRRMVRSKFMLVIIGLLMVGLAGMGLPDMFSSAEPRGMLSAGDRFVVKREVERRLDTHLQLLREREGQTISRQTAAQNGTVQSILQGLANETALLSFADNNNIEASRFAVTEIVANAPSFKNPVTGEFDEGAFKSFAARQGLSIKQMENNLKEDFTRQYIADAVKTAVNTPSALGKVWITAQSEQREFSYVNIKAASAASIADPTDEELNAFFEENKNAFTQPERKVVSILSISPSDFTGRVEIADEDLRDMYDLRIKEFSTAQTREIREFSSTDRRLAQKIVDEIGAGEDADAVLAANTDLKVVRKVVEQSDLSNEEYAQAVFAVEEGNHLGIIELDGLWTGAIVDTIIPGVPTPFEDVSGQIYEEMALEEAEKIFELKQEEFYDLVGGGFSLEEAADSLEVPLFEFSGIDTQGRNKSGSLVGGIVFRPDAVDTLRKLEFESETSDILDDVADGLYVMRLDAVEESYVPELSSIKDSVTQSYRVFEAATAAQKTSDALLAKAKASSELKSAAEELGLDFVKSDSNLTRREIPENLTRAMALQLLNANEGEFVVSTEPNGSRSVLHLEKITNIEASMLDVLAPSGKRAVSESLEGDVENAFVEAVLSEAELEVNEGAIAEFISSMAGTQ